MKRVFKDFYTLFTYKNRLHIQLILLFSLINLLVLINAIFHNPYIGYDAPEHIKYIEILSQFKLPSKNDTGEFYSPPLPYALPALIKSVTKINITSAAKIAQILNFIYSLGLTFYILKICNIINPKNIVLKILSLMLLGMMPVYYKSFSQVRGEPLLAFLYIYAVFQIIDAFVNKKLSLRKAIKMGISLGFLILSRQLGFSIFFSATFLAILLIMKNNRYYKLYFRSLFISFTVALFIGGWFYWHLYKTSGNFFAYNISPQEKISFANYPSSFYFALPLYKLIYDPVRPSLRNKLIPSFYSEFWGDYQAYFSIFGWNEKDKRFIYGKGLEKILQKDTSPSWFTTNRYTMNKYLGRVNMIAIFPSFLMLLSFIMLFGKSAKSIIQKTAKMKEVIIYSFLFTTIAIPIILYFYYLLKYSTRGTGDNIKATYLLQIYPLIAIGTAELILIIRKKGNLLLFNLICILLVVIGLYNFPQYITNYTRFSPILFIKSLLF